MDELPEAAEQEDPADLLDVVYAVKQAEVTANGELYTVHISCGALESPCEIALFGASSVYRNLAKEVVFEKVSLTALSEFYIVRRGNVSTIIKIPTVGIPAEERDNAIYSTIIGDRRGFFRYVSFLLSDNYAETSLEEQKLQGKGNQPYSALSSTICIFNCIRNSYEQSIAVFIFISQPHPQRIFSAWPRPGRGWPARSGSDIRCLHS